MRVAVERLINVALEGLLGVPSRERVAELEPKVVKHQGFAQQVKGARSRSHRLGQRILTAQRSAEDGGERRLEKRGFRPSTLSAKRAGRDGRARTRALKGESGRLGGWGASWLLRRSSPKDFYATRT